VRDSLRYVLPLLLPLLVGRAASQVALPVVDAGDWRRLVGCYQEGDAHFALDSVPFLAVHSIESGSRLARFDQPSTTDTYWRMPARDSVTVVVDGGLYGWSTRYRVRGDTLVGVSGGHTDTPPWRFRPKRVVAVRVPCTGDRVMYPPRPDPARERLMFGYGAVVPTEERIAASPWVAMAPLRAWLDAHPEALSDFYFRINAGSWFARAATLDVRANALELVGTYRLEIQRTGGPPYVFGGRTEVRPWFALRAEDTAAVVLRQAPGYRLRFELRREESALPAPGMRRPGRTPSANSEIDVRLPASVSPDGTRRYRAYVQLVNISGQLSRMDRELSAWNYEWYRAHHQFDGVNVYAEFVVTPDGRVTLTQREELDPRREVTLRGERISGEAWECPRAGC
jgi:hypothetical protein